VTAEQGDQIDLSDLPKPLSNAAWATAAAAALVGQLEAVRGAADKWASTVTALIGAFGAVAVVTGTDAIDQLPASWRVPAVVLTLVAGGFAVASIFFSARAAQGATFKTNNFTTSAYRAHVVGSAPKAIANLRRSRWTGMVAAALVFAGSVASLAAAAGGQDSAGTTVVVIGADGRLVCGALSTDKKTGKVMVAQQDISGATDVQVVESC
jgi:hypothetical protein